MRNPYLTGHYAPVSEERTLTDLEVRGTIPEHLDGRYLRNGPNPAAEVDPGAYHWFVGDGMVHGVRLRDGRAEWYRNRWVRTPGVAADLGEPARRHTMRAGFAEPGANTNVIDHHGRTLALVEAGASCAELSEELETLGACDFDGTVTGGFTAHPKRDPVTGELHAVSYHLGRADTVRYTVVDAGGRARRHVDVTVGGSPMIHDLALTENHVLFLDLPVVFDPVEAARVAVPRPLRGPAALVLSALVGRVRVPDPVVAATFRGNRNGAMPYRWDPSYPARIGVMPREGDDADVRWFPVDPCYVFHTLGALEETGADGGTTIVLDAVRHRRMFTRDRHGPDGEHPRLHRWRLGLGDGRVDETVLDDRGQEFPRVDERRVGSRHRYAYTVSTGDGRIGEVYGDTLLRHDLEAGTVDARRLGDDVRLGEFTFVPHPGDAAEDEGTLMGFVHDVRVGRSRLAMLDAASLETVAEVRLPVRIPHGFHGSWAPAV